jgi:cysteinyl-tRNA synthetase
MRAILQRGRRKYEIEILGATGSEWLLGGKMKIYNTMTRSKEDFLPMISGQVKIYACGPTVYDYFHLGNARPFITFDTLRRYLEYAGYKVEFCQNFTDIDDRMIARANQEGIEVRELADRYIAEYYVDADKLHILRPTYQPRATDTIDAIIEMIAALMQKGYAYEIEDGVYYDVSKFERYGSLSRMNLEDLREGASDRVIQSEDKQSSADFVLWKKKKPGEPSWNSPWGEGRPGWHIECSAMIRKFLGDTIDIHCGGQDLIFPHHENEIAQSEAANETPFVHYWMHNGFINIDNEKMSKSTGNFFTIREIVKEYSYDVIRFFILSSHYRMPINFSSDQLQAAGNGLERISNCVMNLRFVGGNPDRIVLREDIEASKIVTKAIEDAQKAFVAAMDDDLNTADAVSCIFELVRIANTACTQAGVPSELLIKAADRIIELSQVMGLAVDANEKRSSDIPEEIMALVHERTEAKKNRNFALSDDLRNRVTSLGYEIKDTAQGPQVSKI